MSNRGKVTEITPKRGKSGKAFYVIGIGDKTYSTFDQPSFAIGDEVEFEYSQNGRFRNLQSIKVVNRAGGGAAPAPAQSGGPGTGNNNSSGEYDRSRQEYIIRQNALGHAVEIVTTTATTDMTKEAMLNDVMIMAEDIKDYVMTGLSEMQEMERASVGQRVDSNSGDNEDYDKYDDPI